MKITSAYFEITNRCNINCKTCYNRSGLNRETKKISVERLKNAIEALLPFGLKRVLLSGGEPTIHSRFNEILDFVDLYPEISFGVSTNGTNHNKKLIEILNTRKNMTLQISLDGSTEEKNSLTRGAGVFKAATAFVEQIHNPTQKPLLKMVISKDNYSDVENFYSLAVSLNCIPEFAFIYKCGNGSDEWEEKALSNIDKLKALDLIEQLNAKFETQCFIPSCLGGCTYDKDDSELSLCIKTDGTIQPCQSLYDSKFALGNIFSFNSTDFKQEVAKFRTFAGKRRTMDYGCEKCLLNQGCNRGCLAMAYNLTGDIYAGDGDCNLRKKRFLKNIYANSVIK